MNNSFLVDYKTKAYHSFLKACQTVVQKQGNKSFADSIREKSEEIAAPAETTKPGAISARDMTMEEYKQHIYDKISAIPIDPSLTWWHWNIEITDSGFEAMKNDPEYEEYVLNAIRVNFSAVDRYHSANYCILHFGAAKEEARSMSFGMGNPSIPQDREQTFWERRAEQKKRREEEYEEWLDKRAAARRWQQEQLDQAIGKRKALQRRMAEKGENNNSMSPMPVVYEANVAALVVDSVSGILLDK